MTMENEEEGVVDEEGMVLAKEVEEAVRPPLERPRSFFLRGIFLPFASRDSKWK